MSIYQKQIQKYAKCNAADAAHIEEIMREEIFHSTLDWVPSDRFREAALYGKFLLGRFRKDPDLKEYYPTEEAAHK